MADPVDESGLAPVGESSPAQRVEVVGFNMPFVDLVGFMIKVALASIPAALILGFMFVVVMAVLGRGVSV